MCKYTDDMQHGTMSKVGVPKPTMPLKLPVNTARPRIGPGPRMMRRASTGYVHRTKTRRQSGDAVSDIHAPDDFLKLHEAVLERSDSIKLFKQYQQDYEEKKQEEPATNVEPKRIYRRKPRRMSGCAVSKEELQVDLPCLLQRENSVHLIKKRIPCRRASMTY